MNIPDDAPRELVCTRLAEMIVMHPDQDDTHVCYKCEHPVGIYPSGQKALRRWPQTKIICANCTTLEQFDITMPAAETAEEFAQEARDSIPVGKA